jgi:hypothetical protein
VIQNTATTRRQSRRPCSSLQSCELSDPGLSRAAALAPDDAIDTTAA